MKTKQKELCTADYFTNLNYSEKMPTLSAITAISKRYPDIAVDSDKHLFEKKLSILTGIFSLVASRSDDLCYYKIVIASKAWRSHDDSPKT